MTEHKVGTREEWLAARNAVLERGNGHAHSRLLDRTPKGRVDELRATRHDEYEDARA